MSSYPGVVPKQTTVVIDKPSTFNIGWFILVCFLLILIIILIYFFFVQNSNLIDPKKCPKVRGNYAVKPGRFGTVLRSCGLANNQPCRSTENTLFDAIRTCDRRSDICALFSYDYNIRNMEILDPNASLYSANGIDVYERQIDFTDLTD